MKDPYEEKWYLAMLGNGHTPIMRGKELDYFAYDVDGHNGPKCSVCNWGTCWHCDDIDVVPNCVEVQQNNWRIHTVYTMRVTGEPLSKGRLT